MTEQKLNVFIGSSSPNIVAARELAVCLDSRNFTPVVWDEDVLHQNESIFDGLLRVAKEVDFAVFIWGASDIIISDGQSISAVRDNVIFETGLFMGALGKERTFIVVDRNAEPKIPSDFRGIFRAFYNGSNLGDGYKRSAMSTACGAIEANIDRLCKSFSTRLQGKWALQFSPEPSLDGSTTSHDVIIDITARGIRLISNSAAFSFTGDDMVHHESHIFGEWTYPPNAPAPKGMFMLLVNQIADAMYGYCTTQDAHGRTVFGSWVLGKNDGDEKQLAARLLRARGLLQEVTGFSVLQTMTLTLPETDPLHQSAEFRFATLSQTQHKLFFFVLEEQDSNGVLESNIRAECPIRNSTDSQRRNLLHGTSSEYYYRLRELLHLGLLSMEKIDRFENRWKVHPDVALTLKHWLAFHDPRRRQ